MTKNNKRLEELVNEFKEAINKYSEYGINEDEKSKKDNTYEDPYYNDLDDFIENELTEALSKVIESGNDIYLIKPYIYYMVCHISKDESVSSHRDGLINDLEDLATDEGMNLQDLIGHFVFFITRETSKYENLLQFCKDNLTSDVKELLSLFKTYFKRLEDEGMNVDGGHGRFIMAGGVSNYVLEALRNYCFMKNETNLFFVKILLNRYFNRFKNIGSFVSFLIDKNLMGNGLNIYSSFIDFINRELNEIKGQATYQEVNDEVNTYILDKKVREYIRLFHLAFLKNNEVFKKGFDESYFYKSLEDLKEFEDSSLYDILGWIIENKRDYLLTQSYITFLVYDSCSDNPHETRNGLMDRLQTIALSDDDTLIDFLTPYAIFINDTEREKVYGTNASISRNIRSYCRSLATGQERALQDIAYSYQYLVEQTIKPDVF